MPTDSGQFVVIPIAELIEGHCYRVRARNFGIGVWDGVGFVGPREKFGSWYPFREYPSETGSMLGTATPTEDIGCCPITDLREGWSDNRYFHVNRVLLRWLLRRQTILDEEMNG